MLRVDTRRVGISAGVTLLAFILCTLLYTLELVVPEMPEFIWIPFIPLLLLFGAPGMLIFFGSLAMTNDPWGLVHNPPMLLIGAISWMFWTVLFYLGIGINRRLRREKMLIANLEARTDDGLTFPQN